jgi:hypothetical protein
MEKLMQSRDTRGAINRKQGLLNYNLKATEEATPAALVDTSKFNAIIFNSKPKRVYKANRSANLAFSDAKRVHTALREFNDLSASAVFQGILESIEAAELDQSKGLGLKGTKDTKTVRGTLAATSANIQQKME